MGCWTGIGRIVLVITNLVFLMIALAVLAVGILLKFFANIVTPWLVFVPSVSQSNQDQFHIPDLDEVTELPFVDDIGLALIVFGAVLCCISFFACCGACCKFRPLLIMFVILMSILILAQAVVGGLFLAKDSPLHDAIKDTVGDKVKDEFKADGENVFDYSINMMQYLLECCGVRGWDDFDGSTKPPSCCNRTIVDADSGDGWDTAKQQCSSSPPTAPDAYYNPQGCYVKLQDTVLADITLSAIALAVILFIQLLEVIFAILIVKDVNKDNSKIQPY